MGVTLEVPYTELMQAEVEWDDAGDDLDGGWRRLESASTNDFSAPVAAAVDAFREPWVAELKHLAETALDHARAIATYRSTMLAADLVGGEAIRALLPWRFHDARVGEAP